MSKTKILLGGFLLVFIQLNAQWTMNNASTYKVDISWPVQSGADGYLVVRSADSNIEIPVDPNGYQKGDYIGSDQVAFAGASNAFTQYNLRASQHYEWMVFPYQFANGVYNFFEVPFPNLVLDTPFNMVGSYYDGIDSTQSSFITQLQDRIRNPYIKISYNSYDETMLTQYASVDTADGQSIVECVYSQFHYVYTPPFNWLPISREHTYCHSWMPSYSATSTDEYADQHHLFPTQQNNANGVRSNHPFGIVETVQSSFLLGKMGLNAINQVVYEPRDQQKGDAARALLYMALRYDGLDSLDWTFDYLNGVTLPGLSEAPQSLDLLLQWHFQDLPDAFERSRNDYIQSIQQNRNPFIDHPNWVNLIRFQDLSFIQPVSINNKKELDIKIINNGGNPSLWIQGNTQNLNLVWLNRTGQCVKQSKWSSQQEWMSTSDISQGLYFLLITDEEGNAQTFKWAVGLH